MRTDVLLKFQTTRFLRSIAIALALILTGNSIALAAPKQLNTDQARQKISARGIGNSIKVTEASGAEIVGTITGIRSDDFDITAKGTTLPTPILYSNVTALHNHGSSVGRKIGTGIIVGSVALTLIIGISLIAWLAGGR